MLKVIAFLRRKLNSSNLNINVNGYLLNIPKDMSWCFEMGEYYEKNVIYFLDKIIKSYDNPIFLDVGANCGYYSIRYSKFCQKIYSFEPVTSTHTVLCKNIKQNKIFNITPYKIGLSDKVGSKKINCYSSSGNNSLFERSLPPDHPLKRTGTEKIDLDTLDNLIEEKRMLPPKMIKIDVEGAELEVLKGAKKTILEYRPTILLEYADSTANDAGYLKEALLDVVELKDYIIYGISEDVNNLNLISFGNFDTQKLANIIFVPIEHNPFNDNC